jgi:hypothetical protein
MSLVPIFLVLLSASNVTTVPSLARGYSSDPLKPVANRALTQQPLAKVWSVLMLSGARKPRKKMRVVRDDLWLCVDCMLYAVNGDTSGIDDAAREARVVEGVNALGAHLSANWDNDEETGEITEGHREFSRCGCDACGSRLAGEMHRFAVLGEEEGVR